MEEVVSFKQRFSQVAHTMPMKQEDSTFHTCHTGPRGVDRPLPPSQERYVNHNCKLVAMALSHCVELAAMCQSAMTTSN